MNLSARLDQAAAAMTHAEVARARRDRNAFAPRDILGWSGTDQLRFIAVRGQQMGWLINGFLAPAAVGTENWFAPPADNAMVEPSRIRVLEQLQKAWREGRFYSTRWDGDMYALLTLLAGKSGYATVAERETAYLLRLMSSSTNAPLVMLRNAKDVNANGFDGIFLGSVPALGVGAGSRYIGLEVKTVTDRDSLLKRLAEMRRTFSGSKQLYRQAGMTRALKAVKPGSREYELLRRVDASQIATLLVVRSCTLDNYALPEGADMLFDRIITLNVFGRPIPSACKGVDIELLAYGLSQYNQHRLWAYRNAMVAGGAIDPYPSVKR